MLARQKVLPRSAYVAILSAVELFVALLIAIAISGDNLPLHIGGLLVAWIVFSLLQWALLRQRCDLATSREREERCGCGQALAHAVC